MDEGSDTQGNSQNSITDQAAIPVETGGEEGSNAPAVEEDYVCHSAIEQVISSYHVHVTSPKCTVILHHDTSKYI